MKRHLLWTFDRGSFQWDILCLLILAFLFVIPRHFFHDIPEYMQVSANESIHVTVDRNGTMIFTVKLDEPRFLDTNSVRRGAVQMLEESIGKKVGNVPPQPIRDWTGRVVGYAIWKEKG